VAAPVDLLELVEQFGTGQVELLEQSGVLAMVVDGAHRQVELAHPRYGELIREAMASTTRQRVLADHLAWLDARSAAGEADAVRRAIWRLEASGSADPALLLTAARSARYAHDYHNVERLARAALAQKPSSAGQLILGQALADLGRFEEAEATLAQESRSWLRSARTSSSCSWRSRAAGGKRRLGGRRRSRAHSGTS
jgi:predicted Zn-dependent protease